MEIWRDIEGYECLYQISSEGRVKSTDRIVNNNGGLDYRRGRILKQDVYRGGYKQIHLSKDGKVKTHKVHRLVAKAFPEICGEWFDGCEIDHINGVRDDNRHTNLKVCDKKANMSNPITKQNCTINSKRKKVLQYTIDGVFIKEWASTKEVERELGIRHSNISACCLGRNGYQTAGKYKWRYKECA